MAPNEHEADDTDSDSQPTNGADSDDFTRRGLMALGSLAGLGLAGAGTALADDKGSGSGDADTVDGHHAHEFLHVNGSEPATGNLDMGGYDIRNLDYMYASSKPATWVSMDHDDARLRLWDLTNAQAMFVGNVGGPNESYYPLRSEQIGTTRVVGANPAEFDTVEAALNDLPLENSDLPTGHIHITSDWDSTNESTWPIKLQGNLKVTGDGRKTTWINPPDGKYGFLIEGSDAGDPNYSNAESVTVSGLGFTNRSSSSKPAGAIKVRGGIEHRLSDLYISGWRDNALFFTGQTHDADGDGNTESDQTFSNSVSHVYMRGGGSDADSVGVKTDHDYQNNNLLFSHVRVVRCGEAGFYFDGADSSITCVGCTSEYPNHADSVSYPANVKVFGTRAFAWYGGYTENDEAECPAFSFGQMGGAGSGEDGFQASGEVRGVFVNRATHVVTTHNAKSVTVSGITYHNLSDELVSADLKKDEVNVDVASCGPAHRSATDSIEDQDTGYPFWFDGNKAAIRANGVYIRQDLTRSGAPDGRYNGDRAVHDGSGTPPEGVYVWYENGSNKGYWTGPQGHQIEVAE